MIIAEVNVGYLIEKVCIPLEGDCDPLGSFDLSPHVGVTLYNKSICLIEGYIGDLLAPSC